MTHAEITAAARLIRPILTRELSLCRAVYPSTHPDAGLIERIERAIVAFDQLVEMALLRQAQEPVVEPVETQTEHIGLAVSVEEATA